MSNGSGLADPFGVSVAAAAGANPHSSHYYGSASMGIISPPSLETLGLSAGGNILNSGANSGTSNGMSIYIIPAQ